MVGGYYLAHHKTSGYRASLAFTTPLGDATLNELNNGCLMRYAVTVTGGGVALDSAVMNVTVFTVPEPAVAALRLAGQVVLVGVRKFWQKAA